MANWQTLGPVSDFPDGSQQERRIADTSVVVLTIDGKVHVLENVCPHAGLPLDQGECQGLVLTCPYHGYTFNVRTGANIDDPNDEPVRVIPVRETDGTLEIDLDA